MTKKDYVVFANKLREWKLRHQNNKDLSYFIEWILTQEVANIFENDNPKFNRRKFIDYINK